MEEKEILFKNTSKMDENEITLFQNYALKKRVWITSIIFALSFAALGGFLCIVSLTMGIIIIACGCVGGFVLLPYLMKESIKRQNNIILGDKKYLNTFEFFEDYVNITSEATSSKDSNDFAPVATQKLMYTDVFKCVIYKERLFIFINFKGMTKNTIGELIEFLKGKGIKMIDKSNVPVPEQKVK